MIIKLNLLPAIQINELNDKCQYIDHSNINIK